MPFFLLICAFLWTTHLEASENRASDKTLQILKQAKTKASPGRDWQELKRLAEAFPSSLNLSYLRSLNDLNRLKKTAGSTKFHPRYRQLYESAQRQHRFASQRLQVFQREIKEWEELVHLKLTAGLYSPERQDFFRQLLPSIQKNVSSKIYERGLEAFHYLINHLSPPDNEGARFDERFLKPKFAENYRLRKVDFYADYRQNLLRKKKEALSRKDQKSVQDLLAKIKRVDEKIDKWKSRSVLQQKRAASAAPQDRLMGIEKIREIGYTGRRVLVGVIEPRLLTPQHAPHEDIKKRLLPQSEALIADHATHVSGIIGARAQTIFDRVGIAPKINLLFMTVSPDRNPRILYQAVPGREASSSQKKSRILVSSQPSARIDQEQAQLFRQATRAGVRILNTSMVYSVGPQTLKALKDFARRGGVIVKAAGNSSVLIEPRLSLSGKNLSPVQEYQIGTDMGLFKAVMSDPDLKKAFLFVGNLKQPRQMGDSSNRAGFLKERFLSAWGTDVLSTVGAQGRKRLTGTSMSAPMVAGSLALLQEAYPACSPQVLAQNLLDSATSIGEAKIFGQGRLNVAAAFELSAKSCGLPVPPLAHKKKG